MVEVMITLALAAILLGFALPDLGIFVRNAHRNAAVRSLGGALAESRDAAITSNAPVTLCASDDKISCTDSAWADGWIVFRDTVDTGTVNAGETLIAAGGSLDRRTAISAQGFAGSMTYFPDGASLVQGGFLFCDERGAEAAVSLCVDRTGMVRQSDLDCSGATPTCG